MNSNMSPIDWVKQPIQNYAQFSGRASRAEYWWFFLAVIIAYIIIGIIESILGIKGMIAGVYGPLTLLLLLGTLVPSLAVAVRRLHDTNRSGWWILAPIIPYCVGFVLGGRAMMGAAAGDPSAMGAGLGMAGIFLFIGAACALALLVFYCLPGTPGDNQYGPNPYGEGGGTAAG